MITLTKYKVITTKSVPMRKRNLKHPNISTIILLSTIIGNPPLTITYLKVLRSRLSSESLQIHPDLKS